MGLKELRLAAGYSQQEASNALQIKRTSYARYESGDRMPDLRMASKLAFLYGVPLDTIFNVLVEHQNSGTKEAQFAVQEHSQGGLRDQH